MITFWFLMHYIGLLHNVSKGIMFGYKNTCIDGLLEHNTIHFELGQTYQSYTKLCRTLSAHNFFSMLFAIYKYDMHLENSRFG